MILNDQQSYKMKIHFSSILVSLLFLAEIIFAQPGNDNCQGAAVLVQTAGCSPTNGTTVNATQSIPAIICAGLTGNSDDDVWYTFTATTSNPTIYVIGDPSFDAVVDLRSDLCDGINLFCADAKGPGGTERIYTGGLAVGASYLIRIYSYGSGTNTQGTFGVCVFGSPPYPPVNDDCYSATPIDDPSYGSTINATKSLEPVTCGGITGWSDDDVWFKFDAATVNPTITVVGGTYFDAVVDLMSFPCAGTHLFCADATPAGGTENLKASGLTIGSPYLVRIYSYGDGTNSMGDFTVSVSETICLTCPDYDFYLSPGPEWQVHYSLISAEGCNNYQISVTAGNEYTFKTGCGDGATADFDTYLELFDINCNSISGDDNNCEENRSKIVWQAQFNGFVYLNTHGSNPDAYGTYALAYEISDPVSIPRPLDDTPLPDLINVYPNPVSSAFKIESRQQVSFTKMIVYDYTGRMIRIFRMETPVKYFVSDDLKLAPGLYILAIETNKGWAHKRLEIVR
jgi:hypothetical protein